MCWIEVEGGLMIRERQDYILWLMLGAAGGSNGSHLIVSQVKHQSGITCSSGKATHQPSVSLKDRVVIQVGVRESPWWSSEANCCCSVIDWSPSSRLWLARSQAQQGRRQVPSNGNLTCTGGHFSCSLVRNQSGGA